VPEKPAPAAGYGLTLLLHSLSANYNQYANSAYQSQLGERGAGSVVITPNGRGPDGFYMGYTETDTFEVWADVARHYPLDPTWVASSGYSMGGFGTYRLMARYPDLFGRGFSVVGIPGSVRDQLVSLRNTPILVWNGTFDELVPITQAEDAHEGLVEAGVPHVYDQFVTADHLTLASNDEYQPGADYLGEVRADRSPARISYVVDPREDNAAAGVVADHAYWLSGLRVRDAAAGTGTVEVLSEAFGQGVPEVLPVEPGAGAVTGGAFGTAPYVERRLDVAEPAAVPPANRLRVRATNVARVVVDPARARISCNAEVVVDSDGPTEVVLAGCPGAAGGSPAGGATSVAPARGTLPSTGPAALLPALGAAGLLVGGLLHRRRRVG
jgi:LPXTG-motif cell wall-anchored protein